VKLHATLSALLLLVPAVAAADPALCIQGEWRAARVLPLGFANEAEPVSRAEQLRVRALTLSIEPAQLSFVGGGLDSSVAYRPTLESSRRVELHLQGTGSKLPDRLLFEVMSGDSIRANLLPNKLVEFTRLADAADGPAGSACDAPPRRSNPSGLIVGKWTFLGWESGRGVPLAPPSASLPFADDVVLEIERHRLSARRGGLIAVASYVASPPAGKRTRIVTEAPFFGGRFGEETHVMLERRDEKTLSIGLQGYPGHLLVLTSGGAAATPPVKEPDESADAAREADPAAPSADDEVEIRVPYEAHCEGEQQRMGASPPDGLEQWCEIELASGERVRDGWSIAWYANGVKQEAGRYRNGVEHGIWLRWHENGQKSVQAQFSDGAQEGVLIRWDKLGRKQHYLLYRGGEPAR
jgi:hypothetical protein